MMSIAKTGDRYQDVKCMEEKYVDFPDKVVVSRYDQRLTHGFT